MGPERFFPIDHPGFRNLSFRDQVAIVGQYTFHPDEYAESCHDKGFKAVARDLPAYIRKVTEDLALLVKLRSEAPPSPVSGPHLQPLRLWSGYRCLYHRQWGPLDRNLFQITNHWVVNVRLFHLPVLALDGRAFYLWDHLLRTHPSTPAHHLVILTALMVSQADREGIEDVYLTAGRVKKRDAQGRFKDLQEQRERVWGRLHGNALRALPVNSLADLQGLAPDAVKDDAEGTLASIINPEPSHVRLGAALQAHKVPRHIQEHYSTFSLVSRRFTVLGQPRCLGGWVYLPAIPEFFYLRDERFTVTDWDLLR